MNFIDLVLITTMSSLFVISYVFFLFISSISVSSEFIPPSNQVCLGDSIIFHCSFDGSFLAVQTFTLNDVGVTLQQINTIDSLLGIDLTRFSATVENTQNQNTLHYPSLRANITLVNVTKEDNNTIIECKATDSMNNPVEVSSTLILASPPSQPIIQLTPMNSICRVRLQWSYPIQSTLPLTQQITDSVNNYMITVQNDNYLSNPLRAGEDISYTLSAVNCFGDSVTAVSEVLSPPSQPESYSCTADYGIENGVLVLEIDYNYNYAIQTGFSITDDTDNVTVLSGDFIDNQSYYSQDMIEFNSTRIYSVLFTSVLRDCIGSMSTSCQVKLNITAVVTTTPPPPTIANNTPSSTPSSTPTATPTTPKELPPYIIYIVIAIILFLFLLFLSCVIILLACILGRGKLSRSKYVPKDARRLPNQTSTSENNPESGQNGEELHYITPDFPTKPIQPNPAIPKTVYTDISELPVASEALSSL